MLAAYVQVLDCSAGDDISLLSLQDQTDFKLRVDGLNLKLVWSWSEKWGISWLNWTWWPSSDGTNDYILCVSEMIRYLMYTARYGLKSCLVEECGSCCMILSMETICNRYKLSPPSTFLTDINHLNSTTCSMQKDPSFRVSSFGKLPSTLSSHTRFLCWRSFGGNIPLSSPHFAPDPTLYLTFMK